MLLFGIQILLSVSPQVTSWLQMGSDAQFERSISAALCWRGAAPRLALAAWAEEPPSCRSFALENAQAPSVFWAFLQYVAHKEILDPPGEEKKKNPERIIPKRKSSVQTNPALTMLRFLLLAMQGDLEQ